jgi:hypothetical protein
LDPGVSICTIIWLLVRQEENETTRKLRLESHRSGTSKSALSTLTRETKIVFTKGKHEHEELLSTLWSLLKPEELLSARISCDWERIGFQGKDPSTDFRGETWRRGEKKYISCSISIIESTTHTSNNRYNILPWTIQVWESWAYVHSCIWQGTIMKLHSN